jgi:TusE/DsrC/DsvC family sulfur relay protein
MAHADINKYIADQDAFEKDPAGNLIGAEPWSEEIAREKAAEEGITLTDEHWDVVRFLRERFREKGKPSSGRVLVEELDERYADRGGRKHLYQLFPRGPVTQACKIAGLPLPAYTVDPSFGSAE